MRVFRVKHKMVPRAAFIVQWLLIQTLKHESILLVIFRFMYIFTSKLDAGTLFSSLKLLFLESPDVVRERDAHRHKYLIPKHFDHLKRKQKICF
ncbi:hypothetical protein TI04_02255 [Achromatium sp. WMS2]|nr:hypothetical protein TI04_02255 [Achromatium sp. WMS2]